MVKGEAFKRYYQMNRNKILEANKARAKAKDAEEVDAGLERRREAYRTRKCRRISSVLIGKSMETDPFWTPFYARLAESNDLSKLTKKQVDFLLTLDGLASEKGSVASALADQHGPALLSTESREDGTGTGARISHV